MKRFYIITILAITCSLAAMAQNRPDMAHQTNGGNRRDIKTSLSMPSVSLSGSDLTVTNISGYWTVWITDDSGFTCMSPRSFEGEIESEDIGFYASNDVTYALYITTAAGNTYTWYIEYGIISSAQCGEMPANHMGSNMKTLFSGFELF